MYTNSCKRCLRASSTDTLSTGPHTDITSDGTSPLDICDYRRDFDDLGVGVGTEEGSVCVCVLGGGVVCVCVCVCE